MLRVLVCLACDRVLRLRRESLMSSRGSEQRRAWRHASVVACCGPMRHVALKGVTEPRKTFAYMYRYWELLVPYDIR